MLSTHMDSRNALIVVRCLCSGPDTARFGISAGLRWLRTHVKKLGSDHSIDSLANVVVKSCNDQWLRQSCNGTLSDWFCSSCIEAMSLLDMYREHPVPYGRDYAEDRRRCLYAVAKIQMKRSKWREAVHFLRESETLSNMVVYSSDSTHLTVQAVQNALASALLSNGDLGSAAVKAKSVQAFFQSEKRLLTHAEWDAFCEASLTFCRCCLKLDRLDEVSDTLATLEDFSAMSRGALEKYVQSIRGEKERRGLFPFRHKSPTCFAKRPTARRALSVDCTSVIISGPEAEASGVQVDEERAKSVPPMPRAAPVKQFVQSPRHMHSIEWQSRRSRSSGREYFYNTRTGVSTWNDPNV